MILTVAEPIWNQFIPDILVLQVIYTLRIKSLELNKSQAVKCYESTASNIHLWHYYTDIINLVGLKWKKKHLIVTNVCHYRNIKQIFWHLLLAVKSRAYLKLRHIMISIYSCNLNLLLWGLRLFTYLIWYKLNIRVSNHSITSGSCCKQIWVVSNYRWARAWSELMAHGGAENTP